MLHNLITDIYEYLINDADKDFGIDVNNFNFEEYIRNNENNSTKNLKQIFAKDLFFIDFYEQQIKGNRYENIKFNKDKTNCLIKSKTLYEEYKTFYTDSNVSKDGGNAGSNQSFYKSLEFYDFIKSSKINGCELYIINIKHMDEWYKIKSGDSNFEEISVDELKAMGFDMFNKGDKDNNDDNNDGNVEIEF